MDLVVEDIQGAADVFLRVFEAARGRGRLCKHRGPPDVASSIKRTIANAVELSQRSGRPNVMVKIPATDAGIPAIADQIAKGHNINIKASFLSIVKRRLSKHSYRDWRSSSDGVGI